MANFRAVYGEQHYQTRENAEGCGTTGMHFQMILKGLHLALRHIPLKPHDLNTIWPMHFKGRSTESSLTSTCGGDNTLGTDVFHVVSYRQHRILTHRKGENNLCQGYAITGKHPGQEALITLPCGDKAVNSMRRESPLNNSDWRSKMTWVAYPCGHSPYTEG